MVISLLNRTTASHDHIGSVAADPGAPTMSPRCKYCGAPMVETSAYPRRGRRLACLVGNASTRSAGALPCGAPR